MNIVIGKKTQIIILVVCLFLLGFLVPRAYGFGYVGNWYNSGNATVLNGPGYIGSAWVLDRNYACSWAGPFPENGFYNPCPGGPSKYYCIQIITPYWQPITGWTCNWGEASTYGGMNYGYVIGTSTLPYRWSYMYGLTYP